MSASSSTRKKTAIIATACIMVVIAMFFIGMFLPSSNASDGAQRTVNTNKYTDSAASPSKKPATTADSSDSSSEINPSSTDFVEPAQFDDARHPNGERDVKWAQKILDANAYTCANRFPDSNYVVVLANPGVPARQYILAEKVGNSYEFRSMLPVVHAQYLGGVFESNNFDISFNDSHDQIRHLVSTDQGATWTQK